MDSSDYRHLIWYLFIIGLGIEAILGLIALIASHNNGKPKASKLKKRCGAWAGAIACVLVFLAVVFEYPLEQLENRERENADAMFRSESNKVEVLALNLHNATNRQANAESNWHSANIQIANLTTSLSAATSSLGHTEGRLTNALSRLEETAARLEEATNLIAELEQEIDELSEQVQPKPFAERLMAFLDGWEKQVLERLRGNNGKALTVEGFMDASQSSDLRKLCAEPEAKKYIILTPPNPKANLLNVNTDGVSTGPVRFVLSPSLIAQP